MAIKKVLKAKVFAEIAKLTDEEWRKMRRLGIGGSDAAGICGLSDYSSAYTVYLDKLGLLPEKQDNEAMRQGRDFESYVATRFEEYMSAQGTPLKTRKCGYMLRHPKYEYMLANVDRLIVGQNAGLECKTTSVLNKTDFESGDVPKNYYVQCQHYMAVTGAEKWYLAILILNKNFYVFEIPRNEDDIMALINLEKEFWLNHVEKQVEPVPDGSEASETAIKQLYPESDATEIDLFPLDKEVDGYIDLCEQIKVLEKRRDAFKQTVQVYMKETEIGHLGDIRVTWKTYSKTDIDRDKLKKQYSDVYGDCLKMSSYRKFIVN